MSACIKASKFGLQVSFQLFIELTGLSKMQQLTEPNRPNKVLLF